MASIDDYLFHHTSTDEEQGIRIFRCKNRYSKNNPCPAVIHDYDDEPVLYIDLIRQLYRPDTSYRQPQPEVMPVIQLTEDELSSDTEESEPE